ncbi:hypothetical protein P43SY_007020 [Pythium insidiosum]|uniref:Transcription factor Iwr1 domain-containing protein n=1 Tax=Pythium insidiosum TaxID=114742 RepID=A0AAD5LQQ4_PYTIN|nr:hypothetical protein P43SY_007020 [Pythium insidiosum]
MTPFSNSDAAVVVDDATLDYGAIGSGAVKTVVDNQTTPTPSTPTSVEDTQCAAAASSDKSKSVSFADADIVEFEPTLWTATVASDGVPVGLSVTVRRRTRRRLDSWEGERRSCRVHRQEYMEHGYLEPSERLDMLEAAGHTLSIISHVERESMRINRERWESNDHVERESMRINRERWESNEYDLLYQFGLGENAAMDLDEEDEYLLSQGTLVTHNNNDNFGDDDDTEMLEDEDDASNPAAYYFYGGRTDSNVRFSMDDMDSYDTRKYDEWAWDYTTDCILGDDGNQEDEAELPYAKESLDFDETDMSSSPTDVSSGGDCMLVSYSSRLDGGKIIGSGASTSSSNVLII